MGQYKCVDCVSPVLVTYRVSNYTAMQLNIFYIIYNIHRIKYGKPYLPPPLEVADRGSGKYRLLLINPKNLQQCYS